MASGLFGWDLLVKSIESDVTSNDDILLAFTHFVLISNGFKCIGLGESKTLNNNEEQTEALPKGWTDSYALRYLYQGRLYILKCTKLDDSLVINLLRIDERTSAVVQFNSNLVAQHSGSIGQMLPKHSDMMTTIKQELIDKVITSTKSRDNSSQTDRQRQRERRDISPQPDPDDPLRVPTRPVNVGQHDLYPFGRRDPLGIQPPGFGGGGGMLMDPPRGPRYPAGPNFGLPPGSVPPGARFDPFRPPDVDRQTPRRFNRPDNDDFPPPGYDDMFM